MEVSGFTSPPLDLGWGVAYPKDFSGCNLTGCWGCIRGGLDVSEETCPEPNRYSSVVQPIALFSADTSRKEMHKAALYGASTQVSKRVSEILSPKRSEKCTMGIMKQGLRVPESTRVTLDWIQGSAPENTEINK